MLSRSDAVQMIKQQERICNWTVGISACLFGLALWLPAFYTDGSSIAGLTCLFVGWMTVLDLDAGFTWIANPLIFWGWVLSARAKRNGWVVALFSSLIAISFLWADSIISHEAGGTSKITKVGFGYWIWLSSHLVALAGLIVVRLKLRYSLRELNAFVNSE